MYGVLVICIFRSCNSHYLYENTHVGCAGKTPIWASNGRSIVTSLYMWRIFRRPLFVTNAIQSPWLPTQCPLPSKSLQCTCALTVFLFNGIKRVRMPCNWIYLETLYKLRCSTEGKVCLNRCKTILVNHYKKRGLGQSNRYTTLFQFFIFKKSLHGIRQNAHWIARTLFGKNAKKWCAD
jgi:hypothetical protein